jgi:ubiquitin-conjugating enzyme E2 D/E
MAMRRLKKELAEMQKEPSENYTGAPVDENDLFKWKATITGPDGSPYAGGVFSLDMLFSGDYPFKPPRLQFTTKVYHLNINCNGSVKLTTLDRDWDPSWTIGKVLLCVRALLADPNLDDPLDFDMLRQYKENRAMYDSTASVWTHRCAH